MAKRNEITNKLGQKRKLSASAYSSAGPEFQKIQKMEHVSHAEHRPYVQMYSKSMNPSFYLPPVGAKKPIFPSQQLSKFTKPSRIIVYGVPGNFRLPPINQARQTPTVLVRAQSPITLVRSQTPMLIRTPSPHAVHARSPVVEQFAGLSVLAQEASMEKPQISWANCKTEPSTHRVSVKSLLT